MRHHDRHSKFPIPDSTFRVAVVFALPAEFAPWRRRHAFRPAGAKTQQAFEAQIGTAQVRVVFSGIGAPVPDALEQTLFAARPDVVIVAGAAGGLKPQYRCGDVVVASRVKTPGSSRVVAADARMLMLASPCGASVVDAFLTLDRMVLRADEKAALGREADAVDMESFVVIDEAISRGIPAIAIRVIADAADEDLPLDFTWALRRDGTISLWRAIGQAMSRPARWPRIVRAGLSYGRALEELAIFLDRFVAALM